MPSNIGQIRRSSGNDRAPTAVATPPCADGY